MTAMAEVIDESVQNMTHNMVTKAEQEKVHIQPRLNAIYSVADILFTISINIHRKSTLHS